MAREHVCALRHHCSQDRCPHLDPQLKDRPSFLMRCFKTWNALMRLQVWGTPPLLETRMMILTILIQTAMMVVVILMTMTIKEMEKENNTTRRTIP